jgi:hypothetical protein
MLRSSLGPTHPPVQWEWGHDSPGIKRQGCDSDHLLPPIAKVKNGGATFPLSTWLGAELIKHKENFAFQILQNYLERVSS